jgi:chromatin remodeling complex protein RSC6
MVIINKNKMPKKTIKPVKALTTTSTKKATKKAPVAKKAPVKKAPSSKKDSVKKITGETPEEETLEEETLEEETLEEETLEEETLEEEKLPVSDVEDISKKTPKKRRVPTKESVAVSFDDLVEFVEAEITNLRESPVKSKGVKFLRSLNKRLKTLRGQATRVMKQKQRTNRKNNENSGFLKPVQISPEMAKFTGWDHSQLRSRVDVTKYICEYIKENNLQNPQDRRQILADAKLSKLLKYDSKTAKDPLTYFRIQTHMKGHFSKPPVTDAK